MSRYLIISLLVILILGVIGGTIALVVNRSDDDDSTQAPTRTGSLDPSQDGDPGREEGDLPDSDQERERIPLGEAPDAPVAVDQYFSANLDLTGGNEDLTEKYNNQYKEEERTPDTLASFARSQPILTQLPRPVESAIDVQANETAASLGSYLQSAGNLEVFSNRRVIGEALHQLFNHSNPAVMHGAAITVRIHQESLVTQQVPPSAVTLHQLLLGYTELLASTYEQMARYTQDPVRGVTAMHQLEQIDKKFYPIIEAEVARLKSLQQQLAQSQ